MEVITSTPTTNSDVITEQKPPLFFIHGSFHGAWCWDLYQHYFAQLGYKSYAISLRGAGNSSNGTSEKKAYLNEVLDDLDAVYDLLDMESPPVIIGHSTGGLLVQQWAAQRTKQFVAAVLCCSKPPSRFNAMTWRITRLHGVGFAWRMALGFAQNRFANDLELCREVFFTSKNDPGYSEKFESDEKLLEYMNNFRTLSKLFVDLKSSHEPIENPGRMLGKTLVMGGEFDKIVDVGALKQTAEFYGGVHMVLPTPHDIMLCSQWQLSANAIANWLDKLLDLKYSMGSKPVIQIEQ